MTKGYDLFGLRLSSEIDLPELFPASGGADADVHIRPGFVELVEGDQPGLNVRQDCAVLNIPAVGRYRVTRGREIVFERAPSSSERNLRLYLLGSAFAAILHQRGLLPLHANAIEVDGGAVAFMGHSGAGKSTMAAWFLDRGARVLADDVCVVTPDGSGGMLAQPGIPRLRLWREALEVSGRTAADYDHAFDDMDKYNVPTPRQEVEGPLPLRRVYLLEKGDEQGGPLIRRLFGVEAVDALIANTYRGAYLPRMGQTKQHFLACLELVKSVPVFAARRSWGFDRYDEQAQAIADHARGGDSPGPMLRRA